MRSRRKLAQQHSWWPSRWLAISTGILLTSLLFAPLTLAATAQAAYADSGGLCTLARRAISLALPAVVRITTIYQAQITYFNTDGSSIVFPQDGSSYTLTVTGSGAFISGNGDILTANTVVNTPQNPDLNIMLAQLAAPDIARALNDASLSQPVTANDILNQLLSDPYIWQSSFQPPQSSFYFSSQYAGSTTAASFSGLQSFPVTITAQSAPDQLSSNGLAILHADGLHDLPTIPLGDSSQVYQGDTLTILGYPESADLPDANGSVNPDNFITAAVNTITVSAIKTADNGAQLIQIGGGIEPGDSGSPALNSDGQLVGTITFAAQATSGSGQTSFLSTANDAALLAKQINVSTAQDTFDQRWSAAYDTCSSTASGHWHEAYNQYTQIARLYPNFKGVEPFLTYTRTQAAHESTSSLIHGLPGWAIALIVVIILLVTGVGVVLFRRRTLAARAGVSYAGYGPGLNRGGSYTIDPVNNGAQPPVQPIPSGETNQADALSSMAGVPALTKPEITSATAVDWPEPIQVQVTASVQPASSTLTPDAAQPMPGSESNEQV